MHRACMTIQVRLLVSREKRSEESHRCTIARCLVGDTDSCEKLTKVGSSDRDKHELNLCASEEALSLVRAWLTRLSVWIARRRGRTVCSHYGDERVMARTNDGILDLDAKNAPSHEVYHEFKLINFVKDTANERCRATRPTHD